jgi:rubrerythrin
MKKNNSQFLHHVQQAINDTASAIAHYTALFGALDAGSETAPVLRRMVEEKEAHLRGFTDLYRMRAGRRHEPEIRRFPFHSIRHGFQSALREELAAQELYHGMHRLAPSAESRDFLHHVRGDGINHALWLLYLLQGLPAEADTWNGEAHQQAYRSQKETVAVMAMSPDPDPDPYTGPMPAKPLPSSGVKPMIAMPPARPL